MKKIFVSHIALDAALAVEFKKWIELVLKPKCRVFVSSSFHDIKPGARWVKELRDALTTFEALLVICNRKSINSRWVLFESGSAWGRNVPIIPICCDTEMELPAMMGESQVLQFDSPEISKTLIESLARTLRVKGFHNKLYSRMTEKLRTAYDNVKQDSDIIDRIKYVTKNPKLKITERSAANLAAHFQIGIADMKKRAAELTRKGYLKCSHNKIIGDYYSLTPAAERLLLK